MIKKTLCFDNNWRTSKDKKQLNRSLIKKKLIIRSNNISDLNKVIEFSKKSLEK